MPCGACTGAFAGKPAPTVIASNKMLAYTTEPVGAGLPAKALAQAPDI
jgi:hypothetical protein